MPALDSVWADLHYGIVSFRAGGTNRDGGGGEFDHLGVFFSPSRTSGCVKPSGNVKMDEMAGLVLDSLRPWLRPKVGQRMVKARVWVEKTGVREGRVWRIRARGRGGAQKQKCG